MVAPVTEEDQPEPLLLPEDLLLAEQVWILHGGRGRDLLLLVPGPCVLTVAAVDSVFDLIKQVLTT
jgi:hypothetical protein